MPEFGLIKGLAQSGQYDQKIQDLRYNEQADARTKQEAIARAKMNVEDEKYNNAMNPFDNKIVKDYALGIIQNLGRYKQNNPDWEWNQQKRSYVNSQLNELKNNQHVIRGVAVDNQYKELLNDMQEAQKNPQFWDIGALQAEKTKFDNYFKTGHFEGKTGEGIAPPTYSRPRAFDDLDEIHRKVGTSMPARKYTELNNGRDGAYTLEADEKDLQNEATNLYNSHKRQYDVQYKERGIDPIQGIMGSLRGHTKYEYHPGEKNHLGEQMKLAAYKQRLKDISDAKSAGRTVDPYQEVIIKSNYDKIDPTDLAKTFGTAVPFFYYDPKGNLVKAQGDDFHYDGDIYDENYKKDAKGNIIPYSKTGAKITPGFFYKDTDWAYNQGYLKKKYGVVGDLEVKPEFKGKVDLVKTPVDKDGKSEEVVKIKGFNKVNANRQDYQGKFNNLVATTKQRNDIGISDGFIEQDVYEDSSGNKFIKDANGNPVPYQ